MPTLGEARLRRLAHRASPGPRSRRRRPGAPGAVRFGTMETLADVLGVEPEEIDDFSPSFRPRRRTPGGAGTA